MFSQLNTILNLAQSFVSLGMSTGTVKYAAEYNVDKKYVEIQQLLRTTVFFLGAFSLVILSITLVFASEVTRFFFNDPALTVIVVIALFNIPFMVLANQVTSVLQGLKRVKTIVIVNIICSLLSLAVAIPLVILWGLRGVALYLISFGVVNFAAIHVGLKRVRLGVSRIRYLSHSVSASILRRLLPYGAATLVVTLMSMVTDLIIRTLVVRRLGMEQNGIYQVVAGLSLQYWNILGGLFWMYAFPGMCELKHDYSKMRPEINQILRFQALFLVPILATFLTFRDWIIPLFYSGEFLEASQLVFFQALGDLFKSTLWAMGLPLISLERLRTWVLLNFASNTIDLLLFVILFPYFRLSTVVIAFAGSQVIFFFVYWRLMKSLIGYRLGKQNVILVCASVLLFILLRYGFPSRSTLYVGGPLMTLGWAWLVFSKDEVAKLWAVFLRRKGSEMTKV